MANEANPTPRTPGRSGYKASKSVKVFPTAGPSRYAPVVGFDAATARGAADRLERASEINQAQENNLPGFSFGASTPEQRQAYIDVYLNNNPDRILGNGKIDFDPTGGLGALGGRGGGGGMSASDRLDWAKWNYQKTQDAQDAETKRKALGLLQDQLAGGYRGNIDDMLKRIKDMGTSAEGDISSAYTQALGNIGAGYGEASKLMGTGYDALDAYLKQNQQNPYAGLVAASQGQIPDSMNYLQSYGAPTADVQGQIQAEQLAGQQGANAYNQLINVLTGAQNQSNLSRLAESQMARNLGTTQLGSQRAAFEAQAANAQAQALAALRDRIAQQNLQQEQLAGTRRQDIIDQLIAAGINPNAMATGSSVQQAPALSQDVLSQLAARSSRY